MEQNRELTLKEMEMVIGGFRHHYQRLAYRERILNHHKLKESGAKSDKNICLWISKGR